MPEWYIICKNQHPQADHKTQDVDAKSQHVPVGAHAYSLHLQACMLADAQIEAVHQQTPRSNHLRQDMTADCRARREPHLTQYTYTRCCCCRR
jgi:hypothetical protein